MDRWCLYEKTKEKIIFEQGGIIKEYIEENKDKFEKKVMAMLDKDNIIQMIEVLCLPQYRGNQIYFKDGQFYHDWPHYPVRNSFLYIKLILGADLKCLWQNKFFFENLLKK